MKNGSTEGMHEETPAKRANRRASAANDTQRDPRELAALLAIEGHLATIAHSQAAMVEVLARIERHSLASTKALVRLQSAASLQLEIAAATMGASSNASGGNDGG